MANTLALICWSESELVRTWYGWYAQRMGPCTPMLVYIVCYRYWLALGRPMDPFTHRPLQTTEHNCRSQWGDHIYIYINIYMWPTKTKNTHGYTFNTHACMYACMCAYVHSTSPHLPTYYALGSRLLRRAPRRRCGGPRDVLISRATQRSLKG